MPQSTYDPADLDIREQLAHIDQMLAAADESRRRLPLILADIERRQQETRLAPWVPAFGGMTAGAAFLAAGFALAKVLV